KQKAGKARMRKVGRVDVPQEAFIAALRVERGGGGSGGIARPGERGARPRPASGAPGGKGRP
ncbi:MAG TPA: hypothetical protein VEO00_09685, partial [Actinomycetota bacterium]|nr:hypothetical protein [Actinomycetota bacterium]